MFTLIRKWLSKPGGIAQVDELESRVLAVLADAWYGSLHRVRAADDSTGATRMLISLDQKCTVTGTEVEIRAAAERLAHRTGACVAVAVITGYYHRRDCDRAERRRFGN